jgi:cytochrome P450
VLRWRRATLPEKRRRPPRGFRVASRRSLRGAPMLRLLQWLVRQDWLMRLLAPAIGLWNPFLTENRRDPYPAYARVRERAGLYRTPFGLFVASRYDDVAALLRDPRFAADRSHAAAFQLIRWANRDAPDFLNLIDRNLLNLDGKDHARIRGLVNRAFTPRRVAALRPRIEAIVDELLGAASQRGEFELVRDLAHPLPVIVIAELLGVPAADRERFRGWSNGVVQIIDPLSAERGLARAREAAAELATYFRDMLALRRAEPRDDLLSAMLAAETAPAQSAPRAESLVASDDDGGRVLSEGDLLSLATLLLAAGHETTTNLIGNAVLALLRFPEQAERLRAEPQLVPNAVEEFLRFDSPVQFTDRVALEDVELGGQRIRRGRPVGLLLAAANHDPAQFAAPHRLDVGRADNRHLAFGAGPHFCLGAPLARLEAEIALGALLRRFPKLHGDPSAVRYRSSVLLRGPLALPLRAL